MPMNTRTMGLNANKISNVFAKIQWRGCGGGGGSDWCCPTLVRNFFGFTLFSTFTVFGWCLCSRSFSSGVTHVAQANFLQRKGGNGRKLIQMNTRPFNSSSARGRLVKSHFQLPFAQLLVAQKIHFGLLIYFSRDGVRSLFLQKYIDLHKSSDGVANRIKQKMGHKSVPVLLLQPMFCPFVSAEFCL